MLFLATILEFHSTRVSLAASTIAIRMGLTTFLCETYSSSLPVKLFRMSRVDTSPISSSTEIDD